MENLSSKNIITSYFLNKKALISFYWLSWSLCKSGWIGFVIFSTQPVLFELRNLQANQIHVIFKSNPTCENWVRPNKNNGKILFSSLNFYKNSFFVLKLYKMLYFLSFCQYRLIYVKCNLTVCWHCIWVKPNHLTLKKYGHLACNYWHMWITYSIETKVPLTISVEFYSKNQISNKYIALNPVLKINKTNFFYDADVTKAIAEKSMAIIPFKFKHPFSSLCVSVCIWLLLFIYFRSCAIVVDMVLG